MGATAYAGLVSLMNVISRYQHPTCPVSFNKLQMQTLLDKVGVLVEFLEHYYHPTKAGSKGSIEVLERNMISAAYAAEDTIESSYVNRVLQRESLDLYPDLHEAIQSMDHIIQQTICVGVKKHKKNNKQGEYGSKLRDPTADLMSRPKGIVVGIEGQLSHLMDRITTHSPSRKLIPTVGMGGIGKTTLARNVYDHPYIVRCFDTRAWVTISQHYVVKDILLAILQDIDACGNDQMDDEELGTQLHKGLWGKKYLVILDDIWSKDAWIAIMRFFPDNSNQSRILLTTRLWDVAHSISSSNTYEMKVLDEYKSFDLFSQTVYGEEVFPSELEKLGKNIALSCKGLPLAILAIGGLLKLSPKTYGYWASVAKNVSSTISTQDERQCLGILSLSYNHLPVHLRSCFLYMAAFEEDAVIVVSDLIKLWISDGILKPTKGRILEDVAQEYLDNLFGRNLIMRPHKSKCVPTCTLHDLLSEFCLREAQHEKFLRIVKEGSLNSPQTLESERRLVYHSFRHEPVSPLPSMPHVRSIVGSSWSSPESVSCCRLLRALHDKFGFKLPSDFVQLVNIRRLIISSCSALSMLQPSLSLFWNLESLSFERIDGTSILPYDIWELPNLRDLELYQQVALPNPRGSQTVLADLHRIDGSLDFYCTDEVLKLIPNLKELRISYDSDPMPVEDDSKMTRCFANLACLQKLEKLDVSFWFLMDNHDPKCAFSKPENLTFSSNLRILKLACSQIPWENMTVVGSLPNLEELNLEYNAFCGNEWNPIEGEFEKLKSLSIYGCDLNIWGAECSHFPKLKYLKLDALNLKQIPSDIGEISSLETIELRTREVCAVISAKEILDEQHSLGNDDLLVKGRYLGELDEDLKRELEEWAEADNNFRIKYKHYTDCNNDNSLTELCTYMLHQQLFPGLEHYCLLTNSERLPADKETVSVDN